MSDDIQMDIFVEESDRVYVTLEDALPTPPEPPTQWIAVRTSLTLGEYTRLQGMLVGIDKARKPQLNVTEYLRAVHEIAFVDWYLLGRNGQPVPFSKAQLQKINVNHPLAQRALEEFARRNPSLSQARNDEESGSSSSE